MVNWKIKFRLPSKFETGLFVLGFIFFIIFDYAQNHFQDVNNIEVLSIFHISAMSLFWIFIGLYHITLYIAIIRSLAIKGTHPAWDFLVGTVAILGTYFLIAGAVGGIYYESTEAIPWFYNMAQITMYHIFGVSLQVFAFIWFVSTD